MVDVSTSARIEERPRAESSRSTQERAQTPTSSANKKECGSSAIITGAREGWEWRRHLRRRRKDLGSAKLALFVRIGAWATEQQRPRRRGSAAHHGASGGEGDAESHVGLEARLLHGRARRKTVEGKGG
jgi:hypothetical protein